MRVLQNPNFQRHREQIEQTLNAMDDAESKQGRVLFNQMISSAESLDILFTANSDVMPSQQIITMRRDEFHKRCKELGQWLTDNAPDLKLEWV